MAAAAAGSCAPGLGKRPLDGHSEHPPSPSHVPGLSDVEGLAWGMAPMIEDHSVALVPKRVRRGTDEIPAGPFSGSSSMDLLVDSGEFRPCGRVPTTAVRDVGEQWGCLPDPDSVTDLLPDVSDTSSTSMGRQDMAPRVRGPGETAANAARGSRASTDTSDGDGTARSIRPGHGPCSSEATTLRGLVLYGGGSGRTLAAADLDAADAEVWSPADGAVSQPELHWALDDGSSHAGSRDSDEENRDSRGIGTRVGGGVEVGEMRADLGPRTSLAEPGAPSQRGTVAPGSAGGLATSAAAAPSPVEEERMDQLFTPVASPAPPTEAPTLAAPDAATAEDFIEAALAYPLLCALVRREQESKDERCPDAAALPGVEHALGCAWALARRAGLTAGELVPETLLSLLWLVDSWYSQHRSRLSVVLGTYLALHPQGRALRSRLRTRMSETQKGLLDRLNWSANPARGGEDRVCAEELRACRSHGPLCSFVRAEVTRRWHARRARAARAAGARAADPVADLAAEAVADAVSIPPLVGSEYDERQRLLCLWIEGECASDPRLTTPGV